MDRGVVGVGIDIGGGSTKIGLVNHDGEVLVQEKIITPSDANPNTLIHSYIDQVKRWQKEFVNYQFTGVGVGVPGHVIDNHRSTDVCNLPFLNKFPIAKEIESYLKLPVWIENDASYAGIGEFRYGSGQKAERFLMATLGTGIGLTCIINGKLQVTANGTLGDIGHLIVDKDLKYQCRKGCHGCVESVASGEAINRDVLVIAREHPDSYLGQMKLAGERMPTVRDLIEGSFVGDKFCLEKLDETANWIGLWACNVIQIFGPSHMAFGGGWSVAGKPFIDKIYNRAKFLGIDTYFENITFIQASLGNQAGVIGAGITGLEIGKKQ